MRGMPDTSARGGYILPGLVTCGALIAYKALAWVFMRPLRGLDVYEIDGPLGEARVRGCPGEIARCYRKSL
ncbi:unnamed protein product [Dovyalis caffra]|uniref:Uncharacterized protein n=1 Tax=Dovyalis caffra TaxID=77055 RepID=A0AAV1SP67_9ROSI|nr:unnamed protein product [Dovyalis caffra]